MKASVKARWLWPLAFLLLSQCESKSRRPPVYGPPAPQPGYNAPGTPAQGAPAQPPISAPPSAPAPPGSVVLPPTVPGLDPINQIDIGFLRQRALAVIAELVQALPAGQRTRVSGVPLVIDTEVGEVNAFAACSNGKAMMAISDGLLEIEAHLAQAKANDEIFGTNKVDEYIRFIAQTQRPKTPIVRPALGFFDPAQKLDPRRIQRQHQVLDEQIAFVLAHELAHHYLGHLPCTAQGALTANDVTRALSAVVPLLNQPNELAADASGTYNVLGAGRARSGYRWTEGGALLTMQFFSGMDRLTAERIIFNFERSHPPPQLRVPVVQNSAALFRSSGGVQWSF